MSLRQAKELKSYSSNTSTLTNQHCIESVSIRSFSGPRSVGMRENTDQKNSVEHSHFSHNAIELVTSITKHNWLIGTNEVFSKSWIAGEYWTPPN